MKKLLIASAIAGLSLGLSAPTMAADNKYEAYHASIHERGGSGVSGNLILDPQDGQTKAMVTAKNADGMSVGIHRGLCRYAESSEGAPDGLAFDHDPEFELGDVEGGKSSGAIDLDAKSLLGQPRSVAITDGDTVVACGNIT